MKTLTKMEWSGAKLLARRELNGFTLQDLSDRAGLAMSTISSWERGERVPSVVNLELLAQALGVPMTKLLPARRKS